MLVHSYNNRIGIVPKKLAGVHEQLAYAIMMIIVFGVLTLVTVSDIIVMLIFLSLTIGACLRAVYVAKHQGDWFLRAVKSHSKYELESYVLIESEIQ